MFRPLALLSILLLSSGCARKTSGLEVIVSIDADALAACVRVEATSMGTVLFTDGMLREDTLQVGVMAGGGLGNPVSFIARGYLGPGCDEPQQLNLESAPVEATFPKDAVDQVTLVLHAPVPEVDGDRDGYRAPEAGADCDDGRAQVHPGATELCGNGLDDDCDGLEDCAQPACANVGPPELCDGVDNDCDGQPDEGFNLGFGCSAGVAACQRVGVYVCVLDGGSGCSATPDDTLALAEACNELDDDCDGETDEDFVLDAGCQAGIGVCARSGNTTCLSTGELGCTASPDLTRVSRELCDGLDNDCDGAVDQSPQCGGPSQDVTEELASWAPAEAVGDVVEPCSDATLGFVSLDAETAAPWVSAGTQSIRVSYGPSRAAYFSAHYPASRDAGWDLTNRTTLNLAVSAAQPATYGGWSPAGPTVVLCGRDGGYLRLDPLSTTLLATDGGTTPLTVPLAGDGGWRATVVGPFDLQTVDSLEVHVDPARGAGTGTCTLWLDDVRFY